MNFIQAILMGIVQGLSEFLPISSSAHLVFTSNFYKVIADVPVNIHSNQEIFFDIMLHFGTLIAVVIFFRNDLIKIIKAFCHAFNSKDWSNKEAQLGLYIILGTLITSIVAVPLNNFAAFLVYKPELVGAFLIITGIILFFSEYMSSHTVSKKENIDFKTSVIIGLAQGLAAIPGFSRSGWTIATGLFGGLNKITAARYSFLLSIPIIFGASMIYPIMEIDINEALGYNWLAIIAGTLVSGIVGYLCIKYFLKFIAKFSLNIFAWYCLLMGLFTMVFFTIC